MRVLSRLVLSVLSGSLIAAAPAAAQIDARMLRQPDVSATQIAFVYAGDIWVAPKQGGVAVRLSSPRGEESFPRFAPDGKTLAYSANYDGNTDVYTVPVQGGDPSRLTWHPMTDRVLDWHPDGTRVLFASSRESGRQRYSQFYLVAATGGPAEKLAVPYGEFATYSPDGKQIAYLPQSQAFRTWKRYRGGWAPDVWTFDLATKASANVTASDANDEHPMWHGDTLYFLSDRGANQRANIWARDKGGAVRQVTQFADFDVTFPALGPQDIVFEAGGRLYLLNLATEKASEVAIQVVTDRTTLKPRSESVAELIREAAPSPTGRRAVFQARGDVFTVPAEHGPVLNLTRTSGSAERYPRWSPDGKTLAYWTDRSGEYELVLRPADGTGTEKAVTTLGPGYRYPVQWSPDSARLAFIDQTETLRLLDVASGKLTEIDQVPIWMAHESLENLPLRWSADSRWLTWARPVKETVNTAIFLYDTTAAKKHQVTPGYFADVAPVFDPDGKYLYFLSNRAFEPVYGDFDNSWTYPNSTRIVAMALRQDVPSPLAARNDVEGDDKDKDKDGKDKDETKDGDKDKDAAKAKDESKKPDAKADDKTAKKDGEKTDDAKKDKPKPVAIDIDGLDARVVPLPPKAGNYNSLAAVAGKVLYRRMPRTGSGEKKASIVYYDLEEREEKTVLEGADAFIPTADGKKLFVARREEVRLHRGEGEAEGREAAAHRRARDHRRSEGRVEPDVRRRVPLPARLLLRPGSARRRLAGAAHALPGPHRLGGHALGRQLRARRLHGRAERVAHLSRRRRRREGGRARRRPARGRLDARERRLSHHAHRRGRELGRGRPIAAARSRRQREAGRLRPRRQRRAAAHRSGSAGGVPGPGRQGGAAHRQQHAVDDRRAPGDGALPRRRHADALPRVDRGAPRPRRQGDERARRLHLRAEHRRRRAERADAAVHGAVAQGRADHRRALQQRRPDPRPLHRAAEPPDARLLGGAAGRGLAVAADRAPRPEGDADQRLERVGRRRLPVLLPRGEARPAGRDADLGRPHRPLAARRS